MSFSKNLIASATCSIRLANEARISATRRRPEQQQQRPGGAHDRIGVRRDQFVDPQVGIGGAGWRRRRRLGVEIHSSGAASRAAVRIAAVRAGMAAAVAPGPAPDSPAGIAAKMAASRRVGRGRRLGSGTVADRRAAAGVPRRRWRRGGIGGGGAGGVGSLPAGIGTDDRPLAAAERIGRSILVAHRRSSRTAHSSSSSSGQSPEKCMPIEPAALNSGHSGDLRSR